MHTRRVLGVQCRGQLREQRLQLATDLILIERLVVLERGFHFLATLC